MLELSYTLAFMVWVLLFCLVLCLVIIVVCGILWAFVVEWLWVVGFFWLFAYDCGYVGTLVNSVVVCVSLWFGCVACLKL